MQIDSRVLDHREIPRQELVVHRSDELATLRQLLSRAEEGGTPSSIYLLGPSGVGKTMTAQVSLRQAQERASITSAFVNCWRYSSKRDVLLEVVDDTHPKAVHASSTPVAELQQRLDDDPGEPRIVILDEADQLQEPGVLYDLVDAPRTGVIAIANTEGALLQGVDDRIRSRFAAAHRLDFENYATAELVEILARRAEYGIDRGDVPEGVLDELAQAANGDARIAIAALRVAAESAINADRGEVAAVDVEDAVLEAHELVRAEHLERINDHQRALYDVIVEQGRVLTEALVGEYQSRVADPMARRTVMKHLGKLEEYGLVGSVHEGGGKAWYQRST
ncbi:AAA family ATPase [Halorubellus sp. JP-L1]|uniref:Cdc6/Cdc18 family protein n=1 Tax=Halorubellus sp. JP-L1 TaxID=2715753 RepID=UPI00140BB35F|nr:Cdc6/Cdc18 family protein [Halorubellus sp. JP-L1]NHN40516.1 AAA family ATPase [Halorubellus sp. JP-L1]